MVYSISKCAKGCLIQLSQSRTTVLTLNYIYDHVPCSLVHFGGYKVSHICDTEHKRSRINQNYSNFLLKITWNYFLILDCT